MEHGLSNNDLLQIIIQCVNFAAIKHKNQRRYDIEKTPFINHPIGVAYILTHEANITDVNVIQAAILHDTVEDTDTTFQEIEDEFGEKVKNIVVEVTDDKSLSKAKRKELQVLHAKDSSYEAKLVKLADKLYNLRDLDRCTPTGWSTNRVNEYFLWSKCVIDELKGTNAILEEKLYELFEKRNIL